MKKFLIVLMLMIGLGIQAQTAIQESKILDNIYIGAQVGVTTHTSFNPVFPLNSQLGIKLGKNITPVVGFNIEGDMWFGSATHNQGRFSYRNVVRATNVGVNGTVNLFGADRVFTIIPEVGLGWLHAFNSHADGTDDLTAKTGLQFAFNIGKAWQLYAEPTIWWNLTGSDKGVVFNKNYSQLGLQVGFAYKFKNSNGTHGFLTYNIGEMNEEINNLRAKLRNRPIIIIHDTITILTNSTKYASPYYVCFAQNSFELTPASKEVLDNIPNDLTVSVVATASPEGTTEYNQTLSEKRAKAVTDYLLSRGIKVSDSTGLGVQGESSNRIATITVQL